MQKGVLDIIALQQTPLHSTALYNGKYSRNTSPVCYDYKLHHCRLGWEAGRGQRVKHRDLVAWQQLGGI